MTNARIIVFSCGLTKNSPARPERRDTQPAKEQGTETGQKQPDILPRPVE
jgi:hypothetical protein